MSYTFIKDKLSKIKIIVTDIDGVLTNGKITYSNDGSISKQFCIYDGLLVKPMIDKYNLKFLAVTGRDDKINTLRLLPLGYTEVIVSRNKIEDIKKIAINYNITLSEILYIGDDVIDLEPLRAVGVSISCKSAPKYIQDEADYVTDSAGGEGVLREVLELLVKSHGDDILEIF